MDRSHETFNFIVSTAHTIHTYLTVALPVNGQDPGRHDVTVTGRLHFLDAVAPGQSIKNGEKPVRTRG